MLQISAFTRGTFVSSLDVQSAIFENEVRGSSLWLDVFKPNDNEVMLFNRFVHEVPPTENCFVFPVDSFKLLKRLVMCRADAKDSVPSLIADVTILVADDLIVTVRSKGFFFNELIDYLQKSNSGRMPSDPNGLYSLFPSTFFGMFTSDLDSNSDIDIFSEQTEEYSEDIAYFKNLNWTLREITIPISSLMKHRESGSLTMSIMASGASDAIGFTTKRAASPQRSSASTIPHPQPSIKKVPTLIMIKGSEEGREYKLDKSPIRLGRDAGNDVIVVSNGISRKHAIITVDGDRVLLTDLGSTNGTYVNTKRIQQVPLKEGDEIFMGNAILKYTLK